MRFLGRKKKVSGLSTWEYWWFTMGGVGGDDKGKEKGKEQTVNFSIQCATLCNMAAERESKPTTTQKAPLEMVSWWHGLFIEGWQLSLGKV